LQGCQLSKQCGRAGDACRFFWSFDKIKQRARRSGIGLGGKTSVWSDHRDLHRQVNNIGVEVGKW
jgi:hypothetical protein